MYSHEPKDVLQIRIDSFQEILDWLENPDPQIISKQKIQDRLSMLRQEMFDTYGDDAGE